MALYVVGDLQGCLTPLKALLDHVNFDPANDQLWLTGDLINRGPNSIGCLSFVKKMGDSARTVLGNHDLHVLALYELGQKTKDRDISATLSHERAPELLSWLVQQPMLIRDKNRNLLMTHAGIPPIWSDKKARKLAKELEATLADKKLRKTFFKEMYGNQPDRWSNSLKGENRLRYIVNAYTRMRFCSEDATLDFKFKSSPSSAPKGMKPWFQWPRKKSTHRIVFGHWAALLGHTHNRNIIGLDTGYVWGNHLTIMNMDTNIRYCCDTDGKISQYSELEFECLAEPIGF